jgi:tyrosine-protein phosphatase YwqE
MGYKIEFHCHTNESSPCGQTSAKDIVKLYRENQYDGIIITDHFSYSVFKDNDSWEIIVNRFLKGYKLAKEEALKYNIKIYLGMEIRFLDSNNDYLVYGIDEEFLLNNPWLYMKDLKYLDKLCENKYLIVQAHPYRYDNTLADIKYLDGIEYNNTNPNNQCNKNLAYESWIKTNLIGTCGCDFHSPDCISKTEYMLFNNLPNNNNELVKELINRNFTVTK